MKKFDECLPGTELSGLDECKSVLSGNSRVSAQFNYTTDSSGTVLSLSYLAMAFRSVSEIELVVCFVCVYACVCV